jgi:hypothetical protein
MCILWIPVAIILRILYPCKWNHAWSENNVSCGSISPSTTDSRNQLQKWTLLAGSRGCKEWITVVLQGLSFHNCVALLALDFDSAVSWARRFSDFLGEYSSLAPMSCNLSISTRHLCYCFLSINSPVVLSLFTKLWIIFLSRTLSSRTLCRNFRRRFLTDPYFTWESYRNTHCSEVYRTMKYHAAH